MGDGGIGTDLSAARPLFLGCQLFGVLLVLFEQGFDQIGLFQGGSPFHAPGFGDLLQIVQGKGFISFFSHNSPFLGKSGIWAQ